MVNTFCDNCGHEFSLKAQDILQYKFKDIEAQYFKCEACGEIYITRVNDTFINNQMQRFYRFKRVGNEALANKCRDKMVKHIEFVKPIIKESIRLKNA